MYTQLTRKTPSSSSSAFKQALKKPSPSSRIPGARSSSASRIANSSNRNPDASFKENVAPKKQRLTRSTSAKVADAHKAKKGANLENVESAKSIAKDDEEDSFTRPVLAELSSMIVEASDSMRIDFDYRIIDYDEDGESGLWAAANSTPSCRSPTPGLLTPASSDAFDLSDYIRRHCVESPLSVRHNDSIELTRKRSLASLSRGDQDEASISIASIPDSIVYDLDLEVEVDGHDVGQVQVDDDTLDLSNILKGISQECLMDAPLSDVMNVEIDYSLEFPTGALNWAPHISVAKFKRDRKRRAARGATEGNNNVVSSLAAHRSNSDLKENRYVHEEECIIDIPLHRWAPEPLEWNVLTPKKYERRRALDIPSIIVTSPSEGDLAALASDADAATVEDEVAVPEVLVTSPSDGDLIVASGTFDFDCQDIINKSYKGHLLDGSLHNWNLRFNWSELFPDYKDAVIREGPSEFPQLLVTSPSDDNLCIEPSDSGVVFDIADIVSLAYKDYPLDASLHNWNLRFNLDLSGPLDEVY